VRGAEQYIAQITAILGRQIAHNFELIALLSELGQEVEPALARKTSIESDISQTLLDALRNLLRTRQCLGASRERKRKSKVRARRGLPDGWKVIDGGG
jgi:hypothetical protein